MASSLKTRFEQLAADQLKDPSMEEKEVVVEKEIEDPKLGWKHSGNSGGMPFPPPPKALSYFSHVPGGHTAHEGKFRPKTRIETTVTVEVTKKRKPLLRTNFPEPHSRSPLSL